MRPIRGAGVFLGAALAFGSPASADPLAAGRAEARACVNCHGIDGQSRLPGAPHLSGQDAMYTAGQLRAYRSGKRTHPVMNVVAAGLSDEQIEALAAWYEAIEIAVTAPAESEQ